MEYAVWRVLQETGDGLPVQKFQVQELQSATVAAWQQLSQAFLDQSISKWRHRLENIAVSSHIEHVCYRVLTNNDARDFN